MVFKELKFNDYFGYIKHIIEHCKYLLKPTGSIYVCGDFKSTAAIQLALVVNGLHIQNRITWGRDKGRGAKHNFKNVHEDIWFATMDKDNYTFNTDKIMVKRKAIAPYKNSDGSAKDWKKEEDGKKYRLTMPGNFLDFITIPFWSMSENTEHPTQKPEKLMAYLINASSNPGDIVFDPFVGSGTTVVTAAKLGRNYCGIEMDRKWCAITQKRLEMAKNDNRIEGYNGECFLSRNLTDSRA